MDNPEYILNDPNHPRNRTNSNNNYHTLGIPFNNSSPGPSSINAPPFNSLSSTGSGLPNNMMINGSVGSSSGSVPPRTPGSHPRSSAGEEESDEHEYYNEFDRLRREMQPLHPTRTSNSSIVLQPPPNPVSGLAQQSKHETTV